MKISLSLFVGCMLWVAPSGVVWLTDYNQAVAEAERSGKMILLNFSGLDWCGPCIRMEKEIFESEVFDTYAQKNLVLLRADFPRLKKNRLSETQVKKNESLADKYDSQGKFPYTVLMDTKGKVLEEWEGLPNSKPSAFVSEIDQAIHKN
ncbi:MAG: thioredoxin family protein [Sphingobacteriaceae bacterium]